MPFILPVVFLNRDIAIQIKVGSNIKSSTVEVLNLNAGSQHSMCAQMSTICIRWIIQYTYRCSNILVLSIKGLDRIQLLVIRLGATSSAGADAQQPAKYIRDGVAQTTLRPCLQRTFGHIRFQLKFMNVYIAHMHSLNHRTKYSRQSQYQKKKGGKLKKVGSPVETCSNCRN